MNRGLLSTNDQAVVYRQLSALAGAGIAPSQAVSTLMMHLGSRRMRARLEQVLSRVSQGNTLSEGLSDAGLIPGLHARALKAGEMTGRIDLVFASLARSAVQECDLRHRLKSELWHSKLTMFCALPFVIALLPIGHGGAVGVIVLLLLASWLVVLGAEYLTVRLSIGGPLWADRAILKTPALGRIASNIAQSRFARSFAALHAAGVEIAPALRLSAEASGSADLVLKISRALPDIARGESATQALTDANALSPVVVSMLGAGEFAGNIDRLMESAAEFYDGETAVRMHQLCVILGVCAVLIVGTLVGLIAGAVYTPAL